MNNKIGRVLVIVLVAIMVLSIIAIPALAKQNKHKNADGIWCYTPNPEMETWLPIEYYNSAQDIVDNNPVENYGAPGTGLTRVPYSAIWTGKIAGESREYGVAIMHEIAPAVFAPRVFLDALSIDEAEVGGKTGSLYMDAYGELMQDGTWVGNWVITGGTDELTNLQGHGTFWGPGWLGNFEECGIIYYKVKNLSGIDLDDDD